MVNQYKILRLKSGIEIVANIEIVLDQGDNELTIRLNDPMRFGFVEAPDGSSYLQLSLWNPLSLYKERNVVIARSDILYLAEPSNPVIEYYTAIVEKWNELTSDPNREFAKVKTLADFVQEIKDAEEEESLSGDSLKDSKKRFN